MTELFIGVVSHEGTRFPVNQGLEGLAASLSRALDKRGFTCQMKVNTKDAWTPAVLDITPQVAKRSPRASLQFEQVWKDYLGQGGWLTRARDSFTFLARHFKLTMQSLRPSFTATSKAAVRRLVNIELSHLQLWQQGLASGASWVLVIEDDDSAADIEDLADGLAGLLDSSHGVHGSKYVNLSASFQTAELGTGHLLSATDLPWRGHISRQIQQAERPITNTVCAIAYRAELLSAIVDEFAQLPMDPVIPIDFKLNAALIALRQRAVLTAGDCLQVEPPPIIQMSMHGMG